MSKHTLSAISSSAKKRFLNKEKAPASSFSRDILLVLLAGSFTLGGVYLGSSISDSNTKRTEERSLRREIYNDYLDAANAYSVAGSDYKNCLVQIAVEEKLLPKTSDDFKKLKKYSEQKCPTFMSRIATTRYEYQAAINDLFSIGTREAINTHLKIAQHMPASLYDSKQDGLPDIADIMYRDYSISSSYHEFLDRLCLDTRTDDLSICTEDFFKDK